MLDYVCFIDLTNAYDTVDRTLLWRVLARRGVPQNTISVIRQFHDSMRVCVRLDDRVCSGWFAVEQGLRQGCVLAPLLLNIFFAAVINVAYTRFKADKGTMDALVHLRKKNGVGVIVVVCAAFGLTISEAKTEIMCLRTKGMPESAATFSVKAAGKVPNDRVRIPRGGMSTAMPTCPSRSSGAYPTHGAASGSTPSNCTTLELKIRMFRANVIETMLYSCVTWSPRACHYDTLRRAHHSCPARCIGWRKSNRADNPISYLDTLIKTGSESIEATLRRRRILFPGFVARMEDTRLPKCVMFG